MKRPLYKRSLFAPIVCALAVALISMGAYIKFHHSAPAVTHTVSTKKTANIAQNTDAETSTETPAAHVDTQLQAIVDKWAAAQGNDAAVAVQELDGDMRTAAYRSGKQMTTASTYKLCVAYAVLHEVEQGTYTMNTVTRSGQTVSAALNKMIVNSDNTSAESLGFLVGWDRVNQLAAAIGATGTDINNYTSAGLPENGSKLSTAADLTTIITKLQQGSLLNSANTDLLLGLMKTQAWRQRIPAGVPAGIAVADKPGWLDNVQNDAAIVYGPHSTYTLVIMTSGNSTSALADLSKQVYDYLQS